MLSRFDLLRAISIFAILYAVALFISPREEKPSAKKIPTTLAVGQASSLP